MGAPTTSCVTIQLLLVELPNVPAEEIKAAVRWQIKDLLDFPVDEAVIELFDMPEKSNSGKALMAYAIATRRSTLQQHIDRIHEAGLKLDAIDIPELCVRNITALLPQDADGVALLHFREDRGILTITRQGLLYVTRHIDIGLRALNAASEGAHSSDDRLSAVVLEVQRSLDYYESHYDRRPITELVLDPLGSLGRLPELLHEQLGLAVSPLDLSKYFELQVDIPTEQQSACLFAIGAALRTEVLAA